MGEKFLLEGDAELQVRAPASAKIRVVRNGSPFGEAQGTDLRAGITEPGVYRVEVCLKTWGRLRPWIFSNPIYVKKAGAAMVGAPGAED
jgi:hypothetical protein